MNRMWLIYSFFILAGTLISESFCDPPPDSEIIGSVNGKTYFVHPNGEADFIQSFLNCRRYGGSNDMATIETPEENNFLKLYFETAGTFPEVYWIGATNFGRPLMESGSVQYFWSLTGEEITYSNWYPRQSFTPWHQCAAGQYTAFNSLDFLWFQRDCREAYKVICQTRM